MKINMRWAALANPALILSPCLALLHVSAGAAEFLAPEIAQVPNIASMAHLGGPLFNAPMAAAASPVLAAPAANPAMLVPSIAALSAVSAPSAPLPAAVAAAAPLVSAAALPVSSEFRTAAQTGAPRPVAEHAGKTSLAALQERTAALSQPGAEPEREISQLFQGKNNAAAATDEPAPALTVAADKRENHGMATLKDAISLATKAHQGQKDKAGATYINHPLRVMSRMSTDEEKMAAVLHDVVEDTSITLQDLRVAGYPKSVVDAVDALSRRKGETYEQFIERLKPNALARKVKLADLEDNMNLGRIPNPQPKDFERVEKYRKIWRELTALERKESAPPDFKYYAAMSDGKAYGLFVFNRSGNRLDELQWNRQTNRWESNNDMVTRHFFSDLDAEEISRAKAEEIARGFGALVPSESDLMKISDQAEAERQSRKK